MKDTSSGNAASALMRSSYLVHAGVGTLRIPNHTPARAYLISTANPIRQAVLSSVIKDQELTISTTHTCQMPRTPLNSSPISSPDPQLSPHHPSCSYFLLSVLLSIIDLRVVIHTHVYPRRLVVMRSPEHMPDRVVMVMVGVKPFHLAPQAVCLIHGHTEGLLLCSGMG